MNRSIFQRIRSSYKFNKILLTARNAYWSVFSPLKRITLPLVIARRAEVHIHFGCGEIVDKRFINVDARPLPHVHLVTKSPMLNAFSTNSADSIYACHVFEHLSFHMQVKVLTRWYDILKPGGKILLSVPDFDKLVNRFISDNRNPLSIQAALLGGQDYPGNFHCAIFTKNHFAALLEKSGFVRIGAWHPRDEESWPRDHSWTDMVSLNILAYKPQ